MKHKVNLMMHAKSEEGKIYGLMAKVETYVKLLKLSNMTDIEVEVGEEVKNDALFLKMYFFLYFQT